MVCVYHRALLPILLDCQKKERPALIHVKKDNISTTMAHALQNALNYIQFIDRMVSQVAHILAVLTNFYSLMGLAFQLVQAFLSSPLKVQTKFAPIHAVLDSTSSTMAPVKIIVQATLISQEKANTCFAASLA